MTDSELTLRVVLGICTLLGIALSATMLLHGFSLPLAGATAFLVAELVSLLRSR